MLIDLNSFLQFSPILLARYHCCQIARLRQADRTSGRVEVCDDKCVAPVLILKDRHSLGVLGVLVVLLKDILRHPDNYQGQGRPDDRDELEPAH